jgi:uncharacterized membrane protein YheB (UPF0754 family)
MNKSLITNIFSASIFVVGLYLPDSDVKPFVLSAGLFSLSGALTNWLAVHMLFEKVPGLYGSGVIVDRFEEFKNGIQNLVMENFFTEENFKRFADVALHEGLSAEGIRSTIDMDDMFNGFLDVVARSKFGGMLSLVGGLRALEPLRDPFKEEFSKKLTEIVEDLDLTKSNMHFENFRPTVESLVKGKLDQLKPEEVKTILEKIIREHLGWLVVWGGVFGGVIGLLATFATI